MPLMIPTTVYVHLVAADSCATLFITILPIVIPAGRHQWRAPR